MSLKVDQHGAFISVLRLIWWPFGLSRAAMVTPPLAAGIVGGLAWGLLVTLLIAVIHTALWEPWGTIDYYLRDFVPRFVKPASFVFSIAVFSAVVGSLLGKSARDQYRFIAVSLLSIPMLIPALLWSCALAMSDIMDERWVEYSQSPYGGVTVPAWLEIAGSCFWLPVGILVMCVLLVIAFRQVTRGTRDMEGLCPSCAYDLRGSVAAGAVACPECGVAIPESQLHRVDEAKRSMTLPDSSAP